MSKATDVYDCLLAIGVWQLRCPCSCDACYKLRQFYQRESTKVWVGKRKGATKVSSGVPVSLLHKSKQGAWRPRVRAARERTWKS